MANARFFSTGTTGGYGQLELNHVAFPKDGRIEAQCACPTSFTTAAPLENGMIVAVNKVAGVVQLAIETEILPLGIVYTAEKQYDQRLPGFKNFYMTGWDGFYPRIGYLSVGDTFTTNMVAADTAVYTNETEFRAVLAAVGTTPLYGTYTVTGAIAVSTVRSTASPILAVVKETTLADGGYAVKFIVAG